MAYKLFLRVLIVPALWLCHNIGQAQQPNNTIPFLRYLHHPWVDSVFNTLSTEQKIAQLIMVSAYSNRSDEHRVEILRLIREHHIGGLIFFQGGPVRQSKLINEYQAASKVPLLIAMDAEWGLGMRLDSTINFPYQMTLGALQNDSLLYGMGKEIARQMKRSGVHINFAPVVDVNNNPANPVINFRSFGERKENVAAKAIAYMKGMRDNGIWTTAKHFPGHGDTDTDSHFALPQIRHPRARLDTLELYPFRKLIDAGVSGIMIAHLNIPSLDSSAVPSTLSHPIVTDLLRKELGFPGLIVTDAMNMRAVTEGHAPGVVDKDAILAGNDLLEFTENVEKAIAEIAKAIKEKKISRSEIDDRCRKVLAIKYASGLYNCKPIITHRLVEDLNAASGKLVSRNLYEKSITVLKNNRNALPIHELDTLRAASLSIGRNTPTRFQQTLSLYTQVDHFNLRSNATQGQIDSVQTILRRYNRLFVGLHDEPGRPHNRISYSLALQDFIASLALDPKSVIAVFKNPYTLDKLKSIENASALIVTYQDNQDVEDLTAQLIFGGIGATGRLPVTIGKKFSYGDGLNLEGGLRFKYTLPEDAGMNSDRLMNAVDSLVNQALSVKAIPGCVVLVAKDQKVVMHKAYGFQDYADTVQVKRSDLYDLASVTKITTGLPALMKLYDEGVFKLDNTLADFLPKFKRSNKADIPMHDILTHQARFKAWIPFYKDLTKKNGRYRWATIKNDSSRRFPIRLKEHMYLHRKYPEKIVKQIRKSPLEAEKKYLYSDFFFILAPSVVESMTHQDFQHYVTKNFYQPLGGTTITYNPTKRFAKRSIVPTEHDYYFRNQPIHGTVHDEGAIMLGGVSGHAGLFANANDLAKVMQMYLNMGSYGGKRYIRESTLKEWTRTQFPENKNRRALGFDKPNLQYSGENNNTAKDASILSFGHTGFTGTMVWMDPQSGLLYVFLSNRVNPTRDNTRLYQLNTRTKIQQALYDAIDR